MSRSTVHAHHRLAVVELAPAAQLAALISIGVISAVANAYFKRGLGVGGSAIVWSVIPTMLGMAAFPRRLAGTTIGAAAVATVGLLGAFGGATIGPAALTSFAATGVLADVVVARVRPGWSLYVGLTLAGLGANVLAFGAHLIETAVRVDVGVSATRSWPTQIASYALCGALAGLIAATLAYQARRRA